MAPFARPSISMIAMRRSSSVLRAISISPRHLKMTYPLKRLHELFKGRVSTTAYQSFVGSDER